MRQTELIGQLLCAVLNAKDEGLQFGNGLVPDNIAEPIDVLGSDIGPECNNCGAGND